MSEWWHHDTMDLSPYLTSLREDLNAAASAGDENTKRAAAVLSAALEPAARLAIMNALSDLADEITAQLDDTVVDVRLAGRDVRVVVDTRASREQDDAQQAPPPPPPPSGGSENITRMTLRLFEELKSKAEQAAAEQGVSLNTFVQQALQGALQGKHGWAGPWGGQRRDDRDDEGNEMHGWVQS